MAKTIARRPSGAHSTADRRIEETTGAQLRYCAGNRRRIARRLRELDEEWDIESVLESNASIVTALGVIAGAVVNRRVPSVPVSWAASVVRLAANGLLPVEPLLRRLGLRTSREIEIERMALHIMRGDLDRAIVPVRGRRSSDTLIQVVRP